MDIPTTSELLDSLDRIAVELYEGRTTDTVAANDIIEVSTMLRERLDFNRKDGFHLP